MWWASPDAADPAHEALLDPVEQERHRAFRQQVDRDRYTVAVALTRLVLGRHLDLPAASVAIDRSCPDCGKQHGKPRLAGSVGDSGLQFSISHSGDRIAVAVGRVEAVGVDVEQLVGVPLEGLDRHVLAPAEAALLEAVPPAGRPAAFLRYWTRKEAVLKTTGDGLRESPATITVTGPGEPPALLAWPARPEVPPRLRLRDLAPGSGYVACVAVLGAGELSVRELDATVLLSPYRAVRAGA